ncbi:MAG: hypothetical protein K0Q72_4699, partial [Armatimonadetes bacterium]|nr:hypothetical protein [Armatimonadota bacterium]
MLRRAGYIAITVALLACGALPMAWAASSRVQQAHVRRIKACVLRVPSMGEPIASNGPPHPFPTNSPPDPDAVLSETPVPPPLTPNPPPWRWRSTARNQLLFYTLDRRLDMKPDGWEFYNPHAPPYATLEIELRHRTQANGPAYPQGTPIKVSTAPYWEIVLNEANYNILADMDVIYLPISRNDPTKLPTEDVPIPTFFTEEQRRVLTRLADSGVTIWVDWTINNQTMNGVMGGDEVQSTTNPLLRNKNAFFTNLDFFTSPNAVAITPTVGHPLL